MLRGVHKISKLLRGFKKTNSLQLLVQRILKAKTRCPDVLKAQKQEITYKERTYRLKNKKSLISHKSSKVPLIYLQVLKLGLTYG